MKKFILLSVFVLFGTVIFAQQADAVINFTKVTHDFGNIKQTDGLAKITFEFTNTGGKPLNISEVHASCGCTTPTWTNKPVAPGQTGTVEAAYNPQNRPGHFSKTITVTSDAVNSPTILTITGNVE